MSGNDTKNKNMKFFNIPQNPKVLIFDIDSTLYTCPEYAHEQIDSKVRHWAALNKMGAETARKMVAAYRRKWAIDHDGQKISLGNLFTAFGVPIETSIEWRKKLFDPKKYLKRDENLILTLEKLSKRFFMICVTNNPVEPARKTLEAIGISDFFPEIVGLDTLKISKPSKKILDFAVEKAAKALNQEVKYEDCVSIGDRFDIDIALALELGMGGVLVSGAEEVCEMEFT